jgi:hypothetical protein
MIKIVASLAGRYGFRYRRYLQSKLLYLKLDYPGGSRDVKAIIPEFIQYGAYPIDMPDGRRHNVEFGKFISLLKEDDVPDLFVGKTSNKGYFTTFNGKVLGMLNLSSIYNKRDYNTGKLYTFKEWYGSITLDSRTPGEITNSIKDGLNEQNSEVQYIIEQIRAHRDEHDRNDLSVFTYRNPTEGATKREILDIFKATYKKDGWRVRSEFKPIKYDGLNPISIDLVRFHPTLERVYFYELKKEQFDVKAVMQFYGYKTTIESALSNASEDFVNPELRAMVGWDIHYVSLSDNAELTRQASLLTATIRELNFFEVEDFNQYTSNRSR